MNRGRTAPACRRAACRRTRSPPARRDDQYSGASPGVAGRV
ncbi:hypothetical protein C7S16_1039 [Burkholderia thailandensis]|uniref:Uncharacterized protein n=1 Tax=Burkholderia thailandensis TaxID=57975 RepID=A0AAW9CUK5_BURTH|nr:hypothetical protein [Burkholderia thailandensis]MDW9254558.1 hypothetical protein [Burkholderia thailandensis]